MPGARRLREALGKHSFYHGPATVKGSGVREVFIPCSNWCYARFGVTGNSVRINDANDEETRLLLSRTRSSIVACAGELGEGCIASPLATRRSVVFPWDWSSCFVNSDA